MIAYFFIFAGIINLFMIMHLFSINNIGQIIIYIIIMIFVFVLSFLVKSVVINKENNSFKNNIYLFIPSLLSWIPMIWMIVVLSNLRIINPSSITQLHTLHMYNYYALFFQVLLIVAFLHNAIMKKELSNGPVYLGIMFILTIMNSWTINQYSQFIKNNVTDDAFLPPEIA